MNSNRFQCVGVDVFIAGEENRNTVQKTKRDLKIFVEFLQSKNERKVIEDIIPPIALNNYLAEFVIAVKRQDGNECEPTSIRGMVSSIERHLKLKNYGCSILSDIAFTKTMNALKAKCKSLKRDGKATSRLQRRHLPMMK